MTSFDLPPRSSHTRRMRLSALCVLLAWACCVTALADEPSLLDRLNDPSYEVRASATAQLLADHTLTEAQLLELMRQAATPEQRQRLMGVAYHHVLRRVALAEFPEDDQGALGVSSEPIREDDLAPGISAGARRVVLTLPGFPGHEVLRHGDLITGINNRPLPPRTDDMTFAEAIKQYPAGSTITLNLIRQGQPLDTPITLASSRALSVMYPVGPSTRLSFPYARAWQEARRKFDDVLPPVPVLDEVGTR